MSAPVPPRSRAGASACGRVTAIAATSSSAIPSARGQPRCTVARPRRYARCSQRIRSTIVLYPTNSLYKLRNIGLNNARTQKQASAATCRRSSRRKKMRTRLAASVSHCAVGVLAAVAAWRSAVAPAAAQDKTVRAQAVALGAAHRIRCRRRWRTGAARSRRPPAAPSSSRCSRPSSSARPSTTTTWRATASPTSPTSIRAISRAASRSSPRGELPFLMANAKGGSQALDAWYRKYAGSRDEGREVLLRLRARLRARSTPRPRRSWCRPTSRA